MPSPADTLRSIKTFPDLVRYLEDELDWPLQEHGFDELTFEYSPAELGLRDEDAAKVRAIYQLRPLAQGQPFGIFFVEFERKRMPVVVLRRILSHLTLKQRASANRADTAAWNLGDLLFISAFGDEGSDQREIAFAHFHQDAGDLPTLRVLGWDGADTGLKLDHVASVLRTRLCWPEDPAGMDAWRAGWSAAFRRRVGHVIRTAEALAERLAGLARGIRGAATALMRHESERGPLRQLYKQFQTALIHDLTEADFADTYAQTVTYGLLTAAISRTDMTGGRYGTVLLVDDITEMVPVTNPFLKEMLQTFLRAGGQGSGINFDELGVQDVVDLLRGDETDLPAILRDFGNRTRGEDPVIHFYEHFLAAYDRQLKVRRGIFYTPQPVVSYIVRSVHELLQAEFGLEDGLASTVTWGELRKTFAHQTFEVCETSKVFAVPEGTDPNSPFVTILDPATGTGTFLVEVIEVIFQTLRARWRAQRLTEAQQRDAWNAYVPDHLLPRLYGYELMMAPYAIAHMKIGLKLHETGYRFGSTERVRVYLTNALEPASDEGQQLAFAGWTPALAHEALAVSAVKRRQRFTVVVGNPPYSGHSANKGAWIGGLLRDYYQVDGAPLGERNPKWLQDDYVKFIRLGQHVVEQAGAGVLSFITNHGYLDNPTFRGMRQQLGRAFSAVDILDLHGNTKKREAAADGSKDENIFDIQQGVAVCRLTRRPQGASPATVRHADLLGMRAAKYAALRSGQAAEMLWAEVVAQKPFYLFVPQQADLRAEFERGWKITDIFPVNSVGIVTARDALTIGWTADEVWRRVVDFASLPEETARGKYDLGPDARDWKVSLAQEDVRQSGLTRTYITPILYRPFDVRYTYYTARTRGLICMPRPEVMRHMLGGKNLGFHLCRQIVSDGWQHVLVTNRITDDCYVSNRTRERGYTLPLYVYEEDTARNLHDKTLFEATSDLSVQAGAKPNLGGSFLAALTGGWKPQQPAQSLPAQAENQSAQAENQPAQAGFATVAATSSRPTPEDIFHYIYAIFHSPTYRARYAEFLKIDFPRVPLTSSRDLFRSLAALGGDLVALHLLEDDYPGAPWNVGGRKGSPLQNPITTWAGRAAPTVEKVAYADGTVWLDKARTAGFRGVPEAVWAFRVGGYQVCEKWLKDRKGRTLSAEDIAHYQRVVVALHETLRVMGEIDEVIEEHGGWPIQ